MRRGETTLEGGGYLYLAPALRHACVKVSSDSCACGRVSCQIRGPLLLVLLLLGIQLLVPISVRRSELSVAGILLLGFYVLLDLFVFFVFFFFLSRPSSSPSVVSLCSFSFSLGLVLGIALVLIYDENRMGGVSSSASSSLACASCSSS